MRTNESSVVIRPSSSTIECASESSTTPSSLLVTRFYIVVVAGLFVASIGLLCNTLLCFIFFGRRYRNSPMFFLGCVAAFDAAIDLSYILMLVVPLGAEYYSIVELYMIWIHYVQEMVVFGQICKVASVYSLIAASFERFMIVRHWTMTGFARRTRAYMLATIVLFAVGVRLPSYFDMIIVLMRGVCDTFSRYQV